MKSKREWSFIKKNKQRGNWQFIFADRVTGKEVTKSFSTRKAAQAEKDKYDEAEKKVQLKAQSWDKADKSQRREFHDLQTHAAKQGYDLWDAVRHHDKFLATSSIDRIKSVV